ncbi:hypothetical protein KL918_004727 [Ogataea parapolymorpha]|nr:hypothetical protein KL918_004727 [Ogataea parapolymorpha]KAG7872730.1 hypothetical protein KL916_002775 [Ogataea parapolymorpha]
MRLLSAIHNWLVLDDSDEARNRDIVPIPVHRRRWKFDGFVSYWAISSMCAVTWAGGSSIMYMGLTGAQTMGVIVIGNLIISVSALVNSIYGTKYHIGYSVFQRVVFGVKGSVVGVLIRSILSVVWFAYQAWLGGLCINIILSSWSQSYLNMKNTLPESVPMTTQELVGYVIFLIISVPVLMVPPEYYSPFLASGSLCIFFIGIGITAWAVVDNGNSYGTMMTKQLSTANSLGWAWIYGINSWYSSLVAGISNQSDYSRFNKKEWHSHWGILIGCNVAGFIIPLFGIVTASALAEKYGQEFWMPNDISLRNAPSLA